MLQISIFKKQFLFSLKKQFLFIIAFLFLCIGDLLHRLRVRNIYGYTPPSCAKIWIYIPLSFPAL